MAFPDQYGRLWATQVHADFFIKTIEADGHFDFQGNPFTKDVVGTSIEGLEEMDKNLKLVTDLSTLRLSQLHSNSAFVLADVCSSEELKLLPYAPRNILKKQIELKGNLKPSINLQFSVNYQNSKKDNDSLLPRQGIDDGILTSGHHSNLDFVYSIESLLKNSSVPVSQIQQLSSNMLCIDIATKESNK